LSFANTTVTSPALFDPYAWQLAAYIATVVGVIVVSVTVVLAYMQIRETRFTTLLQGTIAVLEMTDKKQFKDDCEFVYNWLPSDPSVTSTDELKHAGNVWRTLNRIGILMQTKMLPKQLALMLFSDIAIKAWDRLSTHVEFERKRRNDPLFMRPFQWFADESRRYRERLFPGQKLQIYREP